MLHGSGFPSSADADFIAACERESAA